MSFSYFSSVIDSGHSQLHMNKPFQTGIGQSSLFIFPTYRSLLYSRTRCCRWGWDLIDKCADVFRYGRGSLYRLVFYSKVQLTHHIFIVRRMYARGCTCGKVNKLLYTANVLWHWSFPPLKRARAGPGVAAFLLSIIPHQSHAQTWWGQLFCSSVQVDTYQNVFYGGCPADNDDGDGLGGPLSVHFIWKHAKTEVTFYQYTWVVIEDSFPS